MQDTKIEWADATWNPVQGCTHVSVGCDNCYAEKMAARFSGSSYRELIEKGRWNGNVRLNERALRDPEKRRKASRIFLCSMGDIFHEAVPFDFIGRIMGSIWRADWHTFMLLTKRPERMSEYFRACVAPPPKNLWIGTTIEDQSVVDSRIKALLEVDATVRFVSCEPLLGSVDLSRYLWISWQCSSCHGLFNGPYRKICPDCGANSYWCGSHRFNPPGGQRGRGIHWVIAGGETGTSARPMHPHWLHGLKRQCWNADVPFFFKGWGAWRPEPLLVYSSRPKNNQCAVHTEGCISKELTPDKMVGTEWAFMVKGSRLMTIDGDEHRAFPIGAPRGGAS